MRSFVLGLAVFVLCIAHARADISLVRTTSQNGSPVILIRGTFAYSDDPGVLASEVAATGAQVITFNSNGGNIAAAMAYGRMIRSLKLDTVQPRSAECASACALAFVGGVKRTAEPGAIGVHQSSFAPDNKLDGHEAVAAVQQVTAQIIAYLIEMGVDPALLQLSLTIPANDMRYLTSSEMVTYKVIFAPTVIVPPVATVKTPSYEEPIVKVEPPSALERRALSVMERYHDAWSRSNDVALSDIAAFYSDIVTFYGKPTSKLDVIADKKRFAERWPLRAYSVVEGSQRIACAAKCVVSGTVEWFTESPARGRMSSGSADFTLMWDPSSDKIVSESGKVIATDRGASEPTRILAQWRGQAAKCREGLSNPTMIASGACERSGSIASKLRAVQWCQDPSAPTDWRRCRSTEVASVDPALVVPVMPDRTSKLDPTDYPATSKFTGKTRLPDFKGRDREFNQFRTRIREGMRGGPNFAGRYTLIQIGCGTGCSFVIVGDNQTGKPSRFPRSDDSISMLNLKFQLDSRLLISQWGIYEQDRCFLEYFDFDGTAWTTLKKMQIGRMDACHQEISQNLR